MKLRTALSALTALAIAASAPALASAQTPAPAQPSGKVVASTPVPNPPENAKVGKAKVVKAHTVKHHKSTKSHRRHKTEAAKATGPSAGKTGAAAGPAKK